MLPPWPQNEGENAVLTGYAPVRTLRDYFADVAAYTLSLIHI